MQLHEAHETVDDEIVAFGPFQLNRTQRTLWKQGSSIAVRCRAMELLLALIEKAGATVSHRALLERVWPNVLVESGTLRVHVAQLRGVLRKADPGNEYVHNVTGHGYRFVAPVSPQRRSSEATVIRSLAPALGRVARMSNLPWLATSVWGRDEAKREIVEHAANKRFVTVTGPGGIGKTTAAIVAAKAFADSHGGGICFLELAAIARPEQIWTQLAAVLGTSADVEDPPSALLTSLAKKSSLLVLDNCEHVIESAAQLAESVLRSCPQVRILATSREPLRASGEVIYQLTPLGLPGAFDPQSRESLMQYPAIQLFVERSGAEFDEEQLSLVAEICRRLAGNALAIEIAACQSRWLGLKALAAGLADEMYLSLKGRRTAQPRHQNLSASFDWSYGLLSCEEQAVLQRVSELPGRFSVDHAAAMIADAQLPRSRVVKCLVGLARKSLLVAETVSQDVLYGLQHLVRAYARGKLAEASRRGATSME